MTDQTAELRAEIAHLKSQIEQQHERFGIEVEKRTAALQRARSEAEASSAAKSDFLATMSHEIRTPIHAILGTMDLLMDTRLGAEQEDYVSTARGSAEALLLIVNDILDFSKIEAGRLTIEPTTVEIRMLVEEVACSLAPLAFEKKVEVICDIYPEVPRRIVVDPVRLRQILTNLYGNAIKFTNRGQILLRVRKMDAEDGQPRLRFDVRDTGIGIARERQRFLFEPFVQADSSTSRRFGGTGLGLAICLRLARLMDGTLGLASMPGRGSQFNITVPLVLPPMPDAFSVPMPIGGKILIVDQNRATCEALERTLTYYGIESGSATDQSSALLEIGAAAQGGSPFEGVLISDGLPDGGGLGLLRQIRKTPALRVLPAGLLRGFKEVDDEAARLGVNVVLNKPVRQAAASDAAQALLGRMTAGDTVTIRVEDEAIPNGRVLLVDDNAANRKIAAAMISKAGITPSVAENGQEAVDAVRAAAERSEPIDLILMDVQMPVLNGLEATAAIRELKTDARHVPIVALTANAMPEDREMCLAAGMDDYLPKPVRGKRMREMLRRWLKEAAQTQAAIGVPNDTILRAPKLSDKMRAEAKGGGIFGLLSRFQASLDSRVADFVELYKESDFRALGAGAYGIREDAQMVGAARLAALASLVEEACKDGDYESADRYARRLPRVARETASAIRDTLGDGKQQA